MSPQTETKASVGFKAGNLCLDTRIENRNIASEVALIEDIG